MAKIIHEISLLDIAPPSISHDTNIKALIEAVNPELKYVTDAIHDDFLISRVNALPENVIDLLAWQWHVDFYEPDLDLATKRTLVLNSIKYHKKKGTKIAITNALEALGFVPTIKEWFEPEMQTPPHTFSITGYYKDDEINVDFLGENTEEILTRIVEITKPVRSSMIYLLVAPTPIDLSEHICKWDFCTWEHFTEKIYDWGILTPDRPLFDGDVILKRYSAREIFAIHDTAFWDFNAWDNIPVRLLQIGSCSENAIIANLEWGEGEKALLFPNIWDNSKWDYTSTFTRSIGSISERIFGLNYDLDAVKPEIRAVVENKILYDLRPRWDNLNWYEHDRWTDNFGRDIKHGFSGYRDFTADLETQNIPSKWPKNKTWLNKNWNNAMSETCNWQIKTWESDL